MKQIKEPDNNNDIPKFKRDSEIQVPKCKVVLQKKPEILRLVIK
jgi:hypothetical protein